MPLLPSVDPLTGQVRQPSDVMVASPMMAAGPVKGLAGAITPEAMQMFKDEMYKRYMAKFFGTAAGEATTPLSSAAQKIAGSKGYDIGSAGKKLAGFLPAFLGGGPDDVELPNESGKRDPRLGPGSILDQLKMSKAVAQRLMRQVK